MIPTRTRASSSRALGTVIATQNDTTPDSTSRVSALSTALIHRGREPYEDWYLGNPSGRWTDPAKNAYESAIEILKKELTLDECQTIWLGGFTSIEHVQHALCTALKEYQKRSDGSKVRKWLSNCSSRIMYYGTVFDVFVQHYPEYVSLVWGTFKFLFIAVMNHEELLIEISKAVSRIADVLPRTELHSALYPTDRMQEAVSMVYAKIIEFSLKAVKWYKKSKLMHSISSIINPFSLSFKDIIDEISERSRKVDELASAAAKAEIRDLHVNIHGLNERICQLTEMMVAHQTLQSEIMIDLRDQKQFFRNAQIQEIGESLLLEDTPIPDQTLECCRSLRNRRRQKTPIPLPIHELFKFKNWLVDPSSSLLLAQGQGVKTSSLDFAADLLDAILERNYPVLWALQSSYGENEPKPSITGILRSLVSQAISLDSSAISDGINPIRKQHLKNMVGITPWFQVLERCLLNIPRLFMVIDLASIEVALGSTDDTGESFRISDFLERMSELVCKRDRGGLKVIIAAWQFQTATSLEAFGIFGEKQIYTDGGKRMERLMRQPKYRATLKRRNGRIIERLKSTVELTGS